MAKDGTNRGGSRPGAGRKPKAVAEKYANGNPGGRKLTTLDFGCDTSDLQGAEMPRSRSISKQKDGSVTCAEEIYKETWEWLHERRCDQYVPTQQIEQYAMSVARWIQCEAAVSEFGFLAKKPTGTVISSRYVTMGREYMKQANTAWYGSTTTACFNLHYFAQFRQNCDRKTENTREKRCRISVQIEARYGI